MSAKVTLEEAQAKLPELIGKLGPGEEMIITENEQPVAKLVRERKPQRQRPGPGLCKDMIVFIAPDFDAPLEDFREYME